eukprot:166099-Rhodomonas_salina.1
MARQTVRCTSAQHMGQRPHLPLSRHTCLRASDNGVRVLLGWDGMGWALIWDVMGLSLIHISEPTRPRLI